MNIRRSILGLGLALAATTAFAGTTPATPATPAKPAAAAAVSVKAPMKGAHRSKCEQRSKLGHCVKRAGTASVRIAPKATGKAAAKKI